jgi:hypothetical protein
MAGTQVMKLKWAIQDEQKGYPLLWCTPFRVEMAEGPGFEPGLTGPEPVVLPLDDPSACCNLYKIYKIWVLVKSIFYIGFSVQGSEVLG